jgi:hypothetical protein
VLTLGSIPGALTNEINYLLAYKRGLLGAIMRLCRHPVAAEALKARPKLQNCMAGAPV